MLYFFLYVSFINSTKLCQGDMVLCEICESNRFGNTNQPPSNTQVISDSARLQGVVINELLCFTINKIDVMPTDLLSNLLSNFYDEETVDAAKRSLFDLTANATVRKDGKIRWIKRRGENKKVNDIQDILSLLQSLQSTEIPCYVASDLNNLPPLSQNHFDISKVLSEIQTLKQDVRELKSIKPTSNPAIKTQTASIQCNSDVVNESRTQDVNSDNQDTSPNDSIDSSGSSVTDHVSGAIQTNNPFNTLLALRDDESPRDFASAVRSCPRWRKLKDSDSRLPFRTVQSSTGQQTPQSRIITGSHGNQGTGELKSASHPRQSLPKPEGPGLFVTRLHPRTNEQDVTVHIRKKTGLRLSVLKLRTKHRGYTSFFVSVDKNMMDRLLVSNKWPVGALVKEFEHRS